MGEMDQFDPIRDCLLTVSSFGAYAASKCALNQMLRVCPASWAIKTPNSPFQHMAAELKRKDDDTIILAMHPGEVATFVI